MIKGLDNSIKLLDDEDGIVFTKDVWFQQEIELATSLNLMSKNGSVYAPLRGTSRKALYEFIKLCFPNFDRGSQWKTFRELFYQELKDRYDIIYRDYDAQLMANVPSYYKKLYNHQKEAVFMICNRKYNLLSFEQGLGKTITSITVSKMMNFNKTIVVCPSVAKWNWYEELQKWGVDKDTITVVDTKATINSKKENWIIINYELLKKHLDKIMSRNIQHLIIDEAHYVKNFSSQRYDNVYNIATQSNCKVTLLTGTPIKNKVDDLFAYLKLCKQYLGHSYRNFIDEYTYYHNTSYGISISKGKNLDKLHAMLSNFLIRKTKKECTDIPDKIIEKCYFELEDYRSDYNKAIKDFLSNKNESELQSSIHTINIITTKSKIKSICDFASNIIYSGKKVVIFTSYREPYDMLMEYFKGKCVGIDGRVPTNKRQELVNSFINDENIEVFIGNITAAGVAINLVNASEVIFCNLPFTNAELEQAVDRLHRIGQSESVNVYYTICRNTTDEIIYNMIAEKASDSNLTIDLYKETIDLNNIPNKLFKELARSL